MFDISFEQGDILTGAFKVAFVDHMAEVGALPARSDLVFRLLVQAMRTLREVPVKGEPTSGGGSPWPLYAQSTKDLADAYLSKLWAQLMGLEAPDDAVPPRRSTARDVTRMEVVFDVYPRLLVGKNTPRDWKILCLVADGMEVKKLAKFVHVSRQTVYDRKAMQCSALAMQLEPYAPNALWQELAHAD